MTNTQNPNEKIAIISDFIQRYKKALDFNNLKLQRKTDSTNSDEMLSIFNDIVANSNRTIGMLDDFARAAAGPRDAIMKVLLQNTKNISCILPYKHMSMESVISELKRLTQSDWSCEQKAITLTDYYDHSKHELTGYFLLKGVPQKDAENTAVKISIDDIKWGEAVPVSNIVLSERVRENYLSNSEFDLFYNTNVDNVLKYHSTISSQRMERNNLKKSIDLAHAFGESNVPKVHPVALDNYILDNRNCDFTDYQNAIMSVLSKFLTHQPELVVDRLNKKLNFLMEKQNSGEETAENCFEAIERE